MIPMEAAEDEPRNIYGNARNDEMILTFHIFSLYHIRKYNISIIHPLKLLQTDDGLCSVYIPNIHGLESATILRRAVVFTTVPLCTCLLSPAPRDCGDGWDQGDT